MLFNEFLFPLALSVLLGALVGSQREIRQYKEKVRDFAGFRTFTFISLLGFLIGFLSKSVIENSYLIIAAIFGMFLINIVAYRTVTKLYPNYVSAITEMVALLTFILGILIAYDLFQISIAIAIIISGTLFMGNSLHKFTTSLNDNEIFATLKFAIISLIILPLLPNKNYSPLDIPILKDIFLNQTFISQELLSQLNVINFYHTWLMVVFISGIAYVGYILMKMFGAEKGIEVTGFLGGLMSSTALTSSFSIESKKLNYLSNPLVIGTVIACSTMFFRIIFEVAVLNPNLLVGITLLLGAMGTTGYIAAIYLFKTTKLNHVKEVKMKSPFTIGPAIKFAIVFMFVMVISKLFSLIFGESGIYFISFLSGITDVDAITISLSNLALSGSITNTSAQIGIAIAAFANTIVKGGIAYYLGSKDYSKLIMIIFSLIIIIGILSMIFLF